MIIKIGKLEFRIWQRSRSFDRRFRWARLTWKDDGMGGNHHGAEHSLADAKAACKRDAAGDEP